MATVKIIPPRENKPEILRVAAYCRVSSDSSDHSIPMRPRFEPMPKKSADMKTGNW